MNDTGKFMVKGGVTYAPDKDPDDFLDYSIDWSQFLKDSDTIDTSTWTVASGITKDRDYHDDTTTTIWLAGGTIGMTYQLTNRITTKNGRVKDKSFSIYITPQ